MVSEKEVEHIAELADIGITKDELEEFTAQFNSILDYFDILDQVEAAPCTPCETFNVLREDEIRLRMWHASSMSWALYCAWPFRPMMRS